MVMDYILFQMQIGGGFAVSLPYCACRRPKMPA